MGEKDGKCWRFELRWLIVIDNLPPSSLISPAPPPPPPPLPPLPHIPPLPYIQEGLIAPVFLPFNANLTSIKRNNNTYAHYGEMASWQMRGILADLPIDV